MQRQLPRDKRASHGDCVVLTAFDSEFSFFRNTLGMAGIRLHHAKTLEQADFLLTVTDTTVVLSDVAAFDCSWRDALDLVNNRHPLATMLVVADDVDEPFLQDAFCLGLCGIVWKPIQFDAAIKLIRTAQEASRERRAWMQESMSARPAWDSDFPSIRQSFNFQRDIL